MNSSILHRFNPIGVGASSLISPLLDMDTPIKSWSPVDLHLSSIARTARRFSAVSNTLRLLCRRLAINTLPNLKVRRASSNCKKTKAAPETWKTGDLAQVLCRIDALHLHCGLRSILGPMIGYISCRTSLQQLSHVHLHQLLPEKQPSIWISTQLSHLHHSLTRCISSDAALPAYSL